MGKVESLKVSTESVAPFRYVSERTGTSVTALVEEALIFYGKALLRGANAALDGVGKVERKP